MFKPFVVAILLVALFGRPGRLQPLDDGEKTVLQLRMPGAEVQRDDDYMCFGTKMDDEEMYITRFAVEGSADKVHHMMLLGCSEVPISGGVWNCAHHGVCRGDSSVMFVWAKNAEGVAMPAGVGFRVGGDRSRVKHLVLQVHYAHKLPAGQRDYSGMDVELTRQRQKHMAGIFMLSAQPEVPPFAKKVHADTHCPAQLPAPITIFAARVHAHSLGTVISAYHWTRKTDKVTEVIKGNPQWPQAFYPTKQLIQVEHDDTLLGRCTYDSDRNTTTYTGATGNDEMCNIYMMYYTDDEKGIPFQGCGYLPGKEEMALYPADSDEPLPPNPVLEAYALHGKKAKPEEQQVPSIDKAEPVQDDDGHRQVEHRQHESSPVGASDAIDLNRVHYKEILTDLAQHHDERQHQERLQPHRQQDAPATVIVFSETADGQLIEIERRPHYGPAPAVGPSPVDWTLTRHHYKESLFQQYLAYLQFQRAYLPA